MLLPSLCCKCSCQVYITHRRITGFLVLEPTRTLAHEYRLLGTSCSLSINTVEDCRRVVSYFVRDSCLLYSVVCLRKINKQLVRSLVVNMEGVLPSPLSSLQYNLVPSVFSAFKMAAGKPWQMADLSHDRKIAFLYNNEHCGPGH